MSSNDHTTNPVRLPHPEFPGYDVDTLGQVFNNETGRRLKTRPRDGYLRVILFQGGKRHDKAIHRLVLETFVGPCPEGMEGCHRDHDRANNQLSNLHWGTHLENMRESVRDNRIPRGPQAPCVKLSEEDVAEIRRLGLAGVRQKDLAERFGVQWGYVGRIIRGDGWTHIPGNDMPPDEVERIMKAHKGRLIAEANMVLTREQVLEIRSLRAGGMVQRVIAERFGITQTTVSGIVNRKSYKHVD